MKNIIEKYFNISNRIFWILFLIVILLYLPFIKSSIFSDNTLSEIENEYMIEQNKIEKAEDQLKENEDESDKNDTIKQTDKNSTLVQWNWIDYRNGHHKLKINVKNNNISLWSFPS